MRKIFALLAGGKAKRLNEIEKLNLEFNGKSMMEIIVQKYFKSGFFDEFVLLSGRKQPGDFVFRLPIRLKVIEDAEYGAGPLSGLVSLLERLDSKDFVFLHAGDMPFSSPELTTYMFDNYSSEFEIIVPESKNGVEPLFGWYRASTATAARKALDAGNRKVVSFYPDCRVKVVDTFEVQQVCDPEICFFNINTPEDYEKAISMLG